MSILVKNTLLAAPFADSRVNNAGMDSRGQKARVLKFVGNYSNQWTAVLSCCNHLPLGWVIRTPALQPKGMPDVILVLFIELVIRYPAKRLPPKNDCFFDG